MASTKEYLDFVLEQLSELDAVSSRAMMGEYILYYRGRVFGGIYDDRLLVKPVPEAVKLMPNAELELPYEGAKEMLLVDDVDNREFLCELVRKMWEELSDIWKKKFFQSFIQEIQLYPEQQENGQVLKSMKFKFPVFYNGQTIEEIRWDKENTVETVCLLALRTDKQEVLKEKNYV